MLQRPAGAGGGAGVIPAAAIIMGSIAIIIGETLTMAMTPAGVLALGFMPTAVVGAAVTAIGIVGTVTAGRAVVVVAATAVGFNVIV